VDYSGDYKIKNPNSIEEKKPRVTPNKYAPRVFQYDTIVSNNDTIHYVEYV